MADFLNAADEIEKHGAQLPHRQQGEVMQFVTFRLGDSIPAIKLTDWREQRAIWLNFHPKPWSQEMENEYHQRFTKQMESWLDEGVGSCLFKYLENRRIMEEVLLRFQGDRVEYHAWVIMPNHVHLLFTPRDTLESLIKAWKGATARRIGQGSIWK